MPVSRLKVASPDAAERVIYGYATLHPHLIFAEINTIQNQKYAYLVFYIASHQIVSIDDILLDDTNHDDVSFSNNISVWEMRGTSTQTPPATFVSESTWQAEYRMLNTACLYMRIKHSDQLFDGGFPEVKVRVQGKAQLRTTTGGSQIYSNNAARCLVDYAIDYAGWGTSVNTNIVNNNEAINVCDEPVNTEAGADRYTCNGYLELNEPHHKNMDEIAKCGVQYFFSGQQMYYQALHYRDPEGYDAGTANGIQYPAFRSITDDDILDWVSFDAFRGADERYTGAEGTIERDTLGYKQNWGQIGAEGNLKDMDFKLVEDGMRAQRLAGIHIEQANAEMRLTIKTTLAALYFTVLDNVRIISTQIPQVNNKVFQIQRMRIETNHVTLQLAEWEAGYYEWTESDVVALSTIKQPVRQRMIASPRLVRTEADLEIDQDGTVRLYFLLSWNHTDPIVSFNYRVFDSANNVLTAGSTNQRETRIYDPMVDTIYSFEITAINTHTGAASLPVTVTNSHGGKTEAPSPATNIRIADNKILWTASTSPDVIGYHIYVKAANDFQTKRLTEVPIANSEYDLLNSALFGEVYFYGVTAVDSSGNESVENRVRHMVQNQQRRDIINVQAIGTLITSASITNSDDATGAARYSVSNAKIQAAGQTEHQLNQPDLVQFTYDPPSLPEHVSFFGYITIRRTARSADNMPFVNVPEIEYRVLGSGQRHYSRSTTPDEYYPDDANTAGEKGSDPFWINSESTAEEFAPLRTYFDPKAGQHEFRFNITSNAMMPAITTAAQDVLESIQITIQRQEDTFTIENQAVSGTQVIPLEGFTRVLQVFVTPHDSTHIGRWVRTTNTAASVTVQILNSTGTIISGIANITIIGV